MAGQIKVSGVWKTFTAIQIRVSSVWKSVVKGQIKVAGVWKTFFESGGGGGGGSLTVTAPAAWNGSANGFASAGTVTSAALSPSVSVTGATGAVTYAWTRVSAPDSYSGGFNCGNSTSAAPYWGAYLNEDYHYEIWRCTATDSVGATGYDDVEVTLSWVSLF